MPSRHKLCPLSTVQCVETIDAVLRHAGLRDRVEIEMGLSSDIIGDLKGKYGTADLLFEASSLGEIHSDALTWPRSL